MPFFNQLYVEKHSGMLMLAKIFSLLFKDEACYNSENISPWPASDRVRAGARADIIQNKVTILYLAYNISSSGARRIPLIRRVKSVTGLDKVDPLLSNHAQCAVDEISSVGNSSSITLS